MYEIIKKFLAEGGKCLLIEDGKPMGVVLTMEEFEKLKENKKEQPEFLPAEALAKAGLMSDINTVAPSLPVAAAIDDFGIGEAMLKDMDLPEASAELTDIGLADVGDVTLEDLGLDELPY